MSTVLYRGVCVQPVCKLFSINKSVEVFFPQPSKTNYNVGESVSVYCLYGRVHYNKRTIMTFNCTDGGRWDSTPAVSKCYNVTAIPVNTSRYRIHINGSSISQMPHVNSSLSMILESSSFQRQLAVSFPLDSKSLWFVDTEMFQMAVKHEIYSHVLHLGGMTPQTLKRADLQ